MPPADNQKPAVTLVSLIGASLGERFNFGRAGAQKSPAEAGLPSGRKRRPKRDDHALAESSRCVQTDFALSPCSLMQSTKFLDAKLFDW